jgi:O-antigen ligase
MDIWAYTLSRVAEKPWFGHGLVAYLGMEQGNFTFPHNIFLSTLFYSGIRRPGFASRVAGRLLHRHHP